MSPDARIVLVRHGQTEWSRLGKHTGRTDVPLTDEGRADARALAARLAEFRFARVLTSPLARARETCALAGLADRAQATDALVEWDYGDYEGRLTADIRREAPRWTVFADGCPRGETAAAVGRRVDPVVEELSRADGDVAVFAHGHVLRVLAARWVGLPPEAGRCFYLDTGRVSVLGREREARVIRSWNA